MEQYMARITVSPAVRFTVTRDDGWVYRVYWNGAEILHCSEYGVALEKMEAAARREMARYPAIV